MQIDNLMLNPGSAIFYDQGFRNVIEDHLTLLKNSSSTRTVVVKSKDAFKFTGDIFGLLQANNIKPEYHWIVMRMNGYSSPSQVDDTLQTLILPDFNFIERLRAVFNTKKTISH